MARNVQEPVIGGGSRAGGEFAASLRRLARAAAIDKLAALAVELARTAASAEGAAFVIPEDDLCHYLDEAGELPGWKGQKFPICSCMAGWAIQNRQMLIVPDVERDGRVPRALYETAGIGSMVILPMNLFPRGGALAAYWRRPRNIGPEVISALDAVTRAAESAIVNRRLGGVPRGFTDAASARTPIDR